MSVVVSNLKLSVSSSKISLNIMKRFSISIIDNKHIKNMSILRFLLGLLAGSIVVHSHFSCWKIENCDINNESNKNKTETRLKIKDKIR